MFSLACAPSSVLLMACLTTPPSPPPRAATVALYSFHSSMLAPVVFGRKDSLRVEAAWADGIFPPLDALLNMRLFSAPPTKST